MELQHLFRESSSLLSTLLIESVHISLVLLQLLLHLFVDFVHIHRPLPIEVVTLCVHFIHLLLNLVQ